MEKIIELAKWILANYQAIMSAIFGVFTALISLFLLVPGEQPEKFLQSCVDFLAKWSRKPQV